MGSRVTSSAVTGDASIMESQLMFKTCARSAKLAPNDPPLIGANLGVVRALRSAVLALDVRALDGSKRFGPCTYPHVEISSKFEALGPRNGRGRTSSNPLSQRLKYIKKERECGNGI